MDHRLIAREKLERKYENSAEGGNERIMLMLTRRHEKKVVTVSGIPLMQLRENLDRRRSLS